MSSDVLSVTDANFEAEVTRSDRPVLIDFWAPWCGPCMALLPTVEGLASVYGDEIKVVKINVDDCPKLAERFGVQGIPNLTLKTGDRTVVLRERTRTRLVNEIDALLG